MVQKIYVFFIVAQSYTWWQLGWNSRLSPFEKWEQRRMFANFIFRDVLRVHTHSRCLLTINCRHFAKRDESRVSFSFNKAMVPIRSDEAIESYKYTIFPLFFPRCFVLTENPRVFICRLNRRSWLFSHMWGCTRGFAESGIWTRTRFAESFYVIPDRR